MMAVRGRDVIHCIWRCLWSFSFLSVLLLDLDSDILARTLDTSAATVLYPVLCSRYVLGFPCGSHFPVRVLFYTIHHSCFSMEEIRTYLQLEFIVGYYICIFDIQRPKDMLVFCYIILHDVDFDILGILFLAAFSSMVEGKNEEMSTTELSGGARIHYIFQSIFVKSLEVWISLVILSLFVFDCTFQVLFWMC